MQKIMFNDTKAVLEGCKTQTRRIVTDRLFQECRSNGLIDAGGFNDEWNTKSMELLVKNSPYKVGEEVAIAQSYKDAGIEPDGQVLVKWVRNHAGLYDDAYQKAKYLNGWHNKMFVRATLMPHRIKITYIRIERLQDISDIDCFAEGIEEYITHGVHKVYSYDGGGSFFSPQEAFASLIDKVSGKGTWDSNPYVFVYGFDLIR